MARKPHSWYATVANLTVCRFCRTCRLSRSKASMKVASKPCTSSWAA